MMAMDARNNNMNFAPVPQLSTKTARSINVDQIGHVYTSIAESANNVAYQQRLTLISTYNAL